MQARSSSTIPPGGEVKTSLLNDLIDLLLISQAMHVWWNKHIHCSNIYFFFSCFLLQLFFKGDRWYK